MARTLDPIDGDAFNPSSFSVFKEANQIVVRLKGGADEIDLEFDNRGQALELLRDIMLQLSAIL